MGGAVGAIAGGVIGGIAGSKKQGGGTQTTVSEPWKKQQPFLTFGFDEARDLYDANKGSSWYTGDTYANINDMQRAGANAAFNYGAGDPNAALISGAAGQGIGAFGDYLRNSGQLFDQAMLDPTQRNIAAAGSYANNPYLDGQIDAASRDITRNLTESVLPGIARNASLTGNTNSSRTGVAEGIALRGAQDRIGDIASTMRGQAWDSGLRMAESARTANMGYASDANRQLGLGVNLGADLATTGSTLAYTNADNMLKAGGVFQGDEQAQFDADFARWAANDERPYNLLDRYWQIVGGNNWGGTQSTTMPKTGGGFMGALQGAIGGGLSGYSIGSGFGGFSQPSSSYSMMPNGRVSRYGVGM